MTTPTPLGGVAPAWRAAFAEAWASAQHGNFGVGAVLVDPADGSVVSAGRNRVAETPSQPGVLAGNMTAHAEMNAFAALDRFDARGLHLYTTLEPCLMCAASAMQLKVAHLHLAAVDEFFDQLDGLWVSHPVTAERRPDRSGPFSGDLETLADFGRFLPMLFTLRHFPGRSAEQLARRHHTRLARVADRLLADDERLAAWLALDLDAAVAQFVLAID